MSRTKRRVGGDQTWKDWTLDDWHLEYGYPDIPKELAIKKATARWYADGQRTMTTPGWWIKMTATVPQRRETRDLLRKVVTSPVEDLEDCPVFPQGKKPHIYYW